MNYHPYYTPQLVSKKSKAIGLLDRQPSADPYQAGLSQTHEPVRVSQNQYALDELIDPPAQFGRRALVSHFGKYSDAGPAEPTYNTLNPRVPRGADSIGYRQGSRLQRREGSMLRAAGQEVIFGDGSYQDKTFENRGRDAVRREANNSQLAATADESAATLNNPLFGFSEGAVLRQQFAKEFKEYYEKSQKSSVSRSRSRSKKERLAEARKEAESNADEGIIGQMQRYKHQNRVPNMLSLKQRYRHSNSVSRSNSMELLRTRQAAIQKQDRLEVGARSVEGSNDVRTAVSMQAKRQARFDDNAITLQDQSMQFKRLLSKESLNARDNDDDDIERYVGDLSGRQGTAPSSSEALGVLAIAESGDPAEIEELYNQETKRQALGAVLQQQIRDKKEKEQQRKDQEKEDDRRVMGDFSQFFRFGKSARAGGGNPIRDHDGNITAEYGNFAEPSRQWNNGQQDDYYEARQRTGYSPTKAESSHMRPTNNFEDITEEEFDRRERAKAEYRQQLQEQMVEVQAAKENAKKAQLVQDIESEERIWRALHDMREEFIKEEVKKGNPDARQRAGRIDMLPPPNLQKAVDLIERRGQRDRSRSRSQSKSKSPGPGTRGAQNASAQKGPERNDSKSRLGLFPTDLDAQSNYSSPAQRQFNPSQAQIRTDDFFDRQGPQYADGQNSQQTDPSRQGGNSSLLQQQERGASFERAFQPQSVVNQLDRLQRLQEEIQWKYKQSAVDNAILNQSLFSI